MGRSRFTKISSRIGFSLLPLRYPFQILIELRIGDAGTVCVTDGGGSVGRQAGDRKSHGDAVVSVRIDLGAAQTSGFAAFDAKAVGAFFNGGAHAAQISGEGRNAVAFFYAEFGGVADLDSLFCV